MNVNYTWMGKFSVKIQCKITEFDIKYSKLLQKKLKLVVFNYSRALTSLHMRGVGGGGISEASNLVYMIAPVRIFTE